MEISKVKRNSAIFYTGVGWFFFGFFHELTVKTMFFSPNEISYT